MGNDNSNLQAAKNIKDDEFYTTYETIQKELSHYHHHFNGKVVLCNCDDPIDSNFCRYFLKNFNVLGLKRLICTSYNGPKPHKKRCGRGLLLDVSSIGGSTSILSDEEVDAWLANNPSKKLKSDGDFRSEECIKFLESSDIVVTNPPFSLFKEFVSLMHQYEKKYLIIGNQNALTYKEIFPLLQNNQAWTGYQFGDMNFRVPSYTKPRKTRYWVDSTGQKWRSLGNAMWLTNLDIERRHQFLPLTKKYNPLDYPKYDSYDAINVKRVTEIPMDYFGLMGVPITIINKYNSKQFEIIGEANHGSDSQYDLFKPTIEGKELFKRILIRLVQV